MHESNKLHVKTSWPNAIPFIVMAVLATAAGLKAHSIESFTAVTSSIDFVPYSIRQYLPLAIPLVELAVASLILLPPTRRVGMYVSTALLIAFSGYLARSVLVPGSKGCSCFGQIPMTVSAVTENVIGVLRNLLLLLLCVLWFVKTRPVRSPPGG